jgi:hypothetical protein
MRTCKADSDTLSRASEGDEKSQPTLAQIAPRLGDDLIVLALATKDGNMTVEGKIRGNKFYANSIVCLPNAPIAGVLRL